MTGTGSFFGCSYRLLPNEACSAEAAAEEVLAAIEIMKPKASPYELVRIGGDQDGSYLLPEDFEGIEACFSPGVNNRKDFEDELAIKYAIKSHMCDYTSDPEKLKTPLIPGMQTFRKLWLDVTGGPDSISLKDWVTELYPYAGRDLMLQMDIEGAEYRNILECPDAILSRFRIIVFEIHDLNKFLDHGVRRDVLLPFLRKLDEKFVCLHVHPNSGGWNAYFPEIKTSIPTVLELTFVRRDRIANAPVEKLFQPELPHPLDIVNNTNRDPLNLGGAWINYHQRPTGAAIKNLEDQLRFVRYSNWALAKQFSEVLEATVRVVADTLSARSANAVGTEPGEGAEQSPLREVAVGSRFIASAEWPTHGTVPPKGHAPLFFHTDFAMNSSITIDLGAPRWIRKLCIYNRTDGCGERARLLFASLSVNQADLPTQRLLDTTPEFIKSSAPLVQSFDGPGVQARFVKIWAPIYTALHFSGIEIYATDDA